MSIYEHRKRECGRKILISVFVLFHFTALCLWTLTPFSERILEAEPAVGFAGRLERRVFDVLRTQDQGFFSILTRHYIDLIGAHQYWDFFAPDIPRIHRYLSVCSDILESAESARIECVGALYRSFDGDPRDAVRPHEGKGSRAFRLVENLVRLHRPDLLDAFTRYWSSKHAAQDERKRFVLLHEFTLHPESRDPDSVNTRLDSVYWIISD